MGLSEILDVNVIADATAIGGGIISAKYLRMRAMSQSNREYPRYQMGLDPMMLAAWFTLWTPASWIEI